MQRSTVLVLVAAIVLPGAALAHDPYNNLKNLAGVRCCNGQDCRVYIDPVEIAPAHDGYILRRSEEFVPMSKTGLSPDGGYHICRQEDAVIRCLLVPPGGV